MKRCGKRVYLILGILTLFFCWFFVGRYGIFGAKVDWISQHSVIPDYFRRQFYETKQLFPEFAMNIGGGQNIYHFAYYGLFHPLFLLSYLLPFVKMGDYLMAVSILCIMASVCLFFYWMQKRGLSEKISFLTAVLFLLATPMIEQASGQVMFINYMPFLCLAFLGVDAYFEKQKVVLYTISVFLMILSSFYFSIGGMFCLVIYGIYRYIEIHEQSAKKMTVSGFIKDGIHFICPMLTAVLLSSILLVPTAMALTGGRSEGSTMTLLSLLLPRISLHAMVYDAYGLGLTTLLLTVLWTGIFDAKIADRFLSISCVAVFCIPVFAFLLNGGLYVRGKVLIPFLPLCCYLTGRYLKKQEDGEISFLRGILPYLATILIVICSKQVTRYHNGRWMLLGESILFCLCYLIYLCSKKKSILFLILPSLCCLIVAQSVYNSQNERLVSKEFYQEITDNRIKDTIQTALEKEKGFYRTEQVGNLSEDAANLNRIWDMGQYSSSIYSSAYNDNYQKFRQSVFELEQPFRNAMMQPVSKNPVFQRLMGVKYIISKEPVAGYEPDQKCGEQTIYRNDQTAPILYATDRLISEKTYNKLEFPYDQTVFTEYAVVKNTEDQMDEQKEMQPVWTKKRLKIRSDVKTKKTITLPKAKDTEKGTRVVYLTCSVNNHKADQDVAVWFEGVRNKLTANTHFYYNDNTVFTYAVAVDKEQKKLHITFGAGDYDITDLKCVTGVLADDSGLYQSAFIPDQEKTKGNQIEGNIEVQNDGYVISSIPYDDGFEVFVDGKEISKEKVNTAFLGFPIQKGSHKIQLVYHAPGLKYGKILSVIGCICFGILIWRTKRKKEQRP